MTERAFSVSYYQGLHPQHLRNVVVLVPSLFWIQAGSKRVFQTHQTADIEAGMMLLVSARERLSFENRPAQGRFCSLQVSFHIAPARDMLEYSRCCAADRSGALLKLDKALQETLRHLSQLDVSRYSLATQTHWLNALYQQLAEHGRLHLLFPAEEDSLLVRLIRYLSRAPGEAHSMEQVCQYFAISRATLIRRLKKHDTRFRDVLLQVRMNHALALMQGGERQQLALALACGYQSPERFSQRFSHWFGISPKQYLRTLPQ